MVLSEENIKDFQALYKSQYGVEISREQAYEKGVKFLRLMAILYRPLEEGEEIFVEIC